jgi:hypothetical protein
MIQIMDFVDRENNPIATVWHRGSIGLVIILSPEAYGPDVDVEKERHI